MGVVDLKSQATSGFLWSAIERFSAQFIQLAVGILLARLLLPEDFGLIGMLSIFIAISQAFVNSGMGSGLIQKKDRSDLDYSTVFIFNIVVSITVYLVLFFTAPFIADFYDEPKLTPITRVLSLNILINALAIVQRTKLSIEIDFKSLAKVNITAIIISGGIAVLLALLDYGVWALVVQQLVNAGVAAIFLWILIKKIPSLKFSKDSFKRLFGFGSKLLASSVYATLLQNIYNISLGKFYSAEALGYFTRAKSFSSMSSGLITQILQKVTYPLLSSIQDDTIRLVSVYRRIIKMTAFITLPAMTLLALLADPLVRILLGEKWTDVIVLLQWFAIAQITFPIAVINMNILNVVGRSDLFLKVDLIKAPFIIIALIITIPLGLEAIVIGQFVTSYIAFFINAYMPGKLFGYGAVQQLKDMLPYFFATLGMALLVLITLYVIDTSLLQLVICLILAPLVYWLVSEILSINELNEVKMILIQVKNKISNKK